MTTIMVPGFVVLAVIISGGFYFVIGALDDIRNEMQKQTELLGRIWAKP
jgi:hypothetical protein